ncbi:hypothetical protein WCLP8_1230001 [uncultured Gammaproteobacteria bacterium]
MGFGLDLSRCAVTGTTEALTHVSPRSGRAVSTAAAQPFLDRLLPLSGFLIGGGGGGGGMAEIAAGLRLTGWFLGRHLSALPPARIRLAEDVARAAAATSSLSAPTPATAATGTAGLRRMA